MLVSGYRGEASLIEKAIAAAGMHCRRVPLGEGIWMLRISPSERGPVGGGLSGAVVFDLRDTTAVCRSVLKQVAGSLHVEPAPMAILVGENFDSGSCLGLESRSCWQLHGPSDSEGVEKALRSFLSVWALVLQGLPYAPKAFGQTN
jgi:hypothetical protein